MKAMILAAGEGTRLRPLTLEIPKVLLPVNSVPLIKYILTWLTLYGISDVAINLHHLGGKIKKFVRDGSQFGFKVTYSEEKNLLGTAGGVKKMAKYFDGPFVVFYGDNLTDFDLSAMVKFHQTRKAMATLAVFKSTNPSQVGMLKMDGDGIISSLIEKPGISMKRKVPDSKGSNSSALANAAVYILEPRVLNYIQSDEQSDFACDIFPKLIAQGAPIYGYLPEQAAYFIDIGTANQYHRANEDVKAGKVKIGSRNGESSRIS